MKRTLLAAFLVGISLASLSQQPIQEDTASKKETKKSYGKFSLDFTNNSVYFGRRDSLLMPYLTPTIGYYDKSGLYANVSLSYLVRSDSSRVDVTTLGGGYDFSIGNFSGEVAAEKFFYNNNSTNVKSEVKGDLSVSALYDFGFAEIYITPGINFAKKSDFWMTMGIDHSFMLDSEKVEIDPGIVLNGSTRNFYGSYYGNRKLKKKNANATITATVPDASSFKIMNYEFSVPFKYNLKKFTFSFTPTYSIPMSPATVQIVAKPPVGPAVTRYVTEKLDNQFYFSLDVEVKF